jgi:hypothetical protein
MKPLILGQMAMKAVITRFLGKKWGGLWHLGRQTAEF